MGETTSVISGEAVLRRLDEEKLMEVGEGVVKEMPSDGEPRLRDGIDGTSDHDRPT